MEIAENLNFHPQLDIIEPANANRLSAMPKTSQIPMDIWHMRKKNAMYYLIMSVLSFPSLPHATPYLKMRIIVNQTFKYSSKHSSDFKL